MRKSRPKSGTNISEGCQKGWNGKWRAEGKVREDDNEEKDIEKSEIRRVIKKGKRKSGGG